MRATVILEDKNGKISENLCEVSDDGRIKLFLDTFGEDYRMCFQTPKTTSKGDFIMRYKERVYILSINKQ